MGRNTLTETDSLPATRDEARHQQVKRYFTGRDCHLGHSAARYASSGACVECAGDTKKRHVIPAIRRPRRGVSGYTQDRHANVGMVLSKMSLSQIEGMKEIWESSSIEHMESALETLATQGGEPFTRTPAPQGEVTCQI